MSNTLKLGNGKWATGKDTLLGYNSENNNIKPLPFSFSRDSSGTVINKDGLIETVGTGEPRIDFKDNTKGALLLEPERTNLITHSEDFSHSGWFKGGVSVTSGFLSPDGTTNAYKITENTTNSVHKLQIFLGVSNSFQIQSIFVKYDNSQQFIQTTSSRSVNNYVNFDILNKTFTNYGTSVGSIVELNNGWLRLDVYHDSSTTVYWHFITSLNAAWSESYLGTEKYLLIYGAQLEQGSYATSYIPTSGQANGVTRVADACTNGANEQVINSTEGVLYAEIAKLDVLANESSIKLTKDSSNEIRLNLATNNRLNVFVNVGGVNQVYLDNTTFNLENYNKIAVKYKLNDYSIFVNGTKIHTDTSATVPPNMNELKFNNFYGNTKDLRIYNTALTDQELIALTTI